MLPGAFLSQFSALTQSSFRGRATVRPTSSIQYSRWACDFWVIAIVSNRRKLLLGNYYAPQIQLPCYCVPVTYKSARRRLSRWPPLPSTVVGFCDTRTALLLVGDYSPLLWPAVFPLSSCGSFSHASTRGRARTDGRRQTRDATCGPRRVRRRG